MESVKPMPAKAALLFNKADQLELTLCQQLNRMGYYRAIRLFLKASAALVTACSAHAGAACAVYLWCRGVIRAGPYHHQCAALCGVIQPVKKPSGAPATFYLLSRHHRPHGTAGFIQLPVRPHHECGELCCFILRVFPGAVLAGCTFCPAGGVVAGNSGHALPHGCAGWCGTGKPYQLRLTGVISGRHVCLSSAAIVQNSLVVRITPAAADSVAGSDHQYRVTARPGFCV